MSSRALLLVAACTLACGGKTPPASQIRDGSDLELTDCTILEKVNGTSTDADNAIAERDAKNAARQKAAAIGATHIKWIVPCCTSVEGYAYRCDLPDGP